VLLACVLSCANQKTFEGKESPVTFNHRDGNTFKNKMFILSSQNTIELPRTELRCYVTHTHSTGGEKSLKRTDHQPDGAFTTTVYYVDSPDKPHKIEFTGAYSGLAILDRFKLKYREQKNSPSDWIITHDKHNDVLSLTEENPLHIDQIRTKNYIDFNSEFWAVVLVKSTLPTSNDPRIASEESPKATLHLTKCDR
jgi:hypothetical protein